VAVTDQAVRDFFSWVRIGLASSIAKVDDGVSTNQPANADVKVDLTINDTVSSTTATFAVAVTAYGPGDATSIDSRQIIRTDPADGSADFEPNYFPFVEFHRPDLPWMFTPLSGDANHQLRPSICLVVVEAAGPATLDPKSATNPVAILHLPDASELPDLGESRYWAHAQVTAKKSDNDGSTLLGANPDQTLSRLMCPRRLKPDTAYLACVVPTFDAGVQSGLGQPVNTIDLTPAWTAGSKSAIALPVFHSWSFSTGIGGDFASLLQAIIANSPPVVPAGFGTRDLNIPKLGYGIGPDAGVVQLGTALVLAPGPSPLPSLPTGFPGSFQKMLDQTANQGVPVIGPPVYGSWYTNHADLGSAGWLQDLNLDPRRRAIAALGVLVVLNQQEQLMASAWDQLAGIQDGNQALRHAQLAREVSTATHANRFAARDAGPVLQATQPVHSRVPVVQSTFASEIANSSLPNSVLTAAFRSLTRPQGAIARRFGLRQRQPSQFVEGLAGGTLHLAGDWTRPDGTVSMVDVDKVAGVGPPYPDLPDAKIPAAPPLLGWALPQSGAPPRTTDVQWAADTADQLIPQPPRYSDLSQADFKTMSATFQQAAASMQNRFAPPTVPTQKVRPKLPDDLHQHLLERLHPEKTVTNAVQNRVQVDAKVWNRSDPLQPMVDVPTFPYPMSQSLADLAQDLLLPGLDLLPAESAVMLDPDHAFVESFMVGANQTMLQELLWRGFPTHKRGTCFSQFWATGVRAAGGDIPPIQSWDGSKSLGGNSQGWATAPLVLAIRSTIFRRYPHTSVYAAQAVTDTTDMLHTTRSPSSNEKYPILNTSFDPDIRLFGFDLDPAAAVGKVNTDGTIADPGWYFVLAEHPTAARFGLEPAQSEKFKADPPDWATVNWANLVDDQAALDKLVFAPARWRDGGSYTLPPSPPPPTTPTLTWGLSDSAQMAAITVRLPVRVAIHASALLVKTAGK